MSFADTKTAFETRYQTQILAARAGLPIQFGNAPFERPERSEWTRFTLSEADTGSPGATGQITIGSATVATRRYRGLVVVAIFVPERTDTVLVAAIADDIDAIFRGANFSFGNSGPIRCRTPRLIELGREDDGFWQSQVQVDYERTIVG
ncbi:hypothetical protein LCGC14_1455100 [marine sediment metagenome]|uniref:Uncharacterized protein n=1 Tax=marine sediment metagenome TaxID=412755 RepID=A0A0F9JGM9_9ZZZZ